MASGHSPSLFMEQIVCTTESKGEEGIDERERGCEVIMEEKSDSVIRSDREEKDSKRADKMFNTCLHVPMSDLGHSISPPCMLTCIWKSQ